jgi:hypothetical protein
VKKTKLDFVPKRNVAQVQGCSKQVTFEDPLITDIIRSREVVASVPVEYVLNLEKRYFLPFLLKQISCNQFRWKFIPLIWLRNKEMINKITNILIC